MEKYNRRCGRRALSLNCGASASVSVLVVCPGALEKERSRWYVTDK